MDSFISVPLLLFAQARKLRYNEFEKCFLNRFDRVLKFFPSFFFSRAEGSNPTCAGLTGVLKCLNSTSSVLQGTGVRIPYVESNSCFVAHGPWGEKERQLIRILTHPLLIWREQFKLQPRVFFVRVARNSLALIVGEIKYSAGNPRSLWLAELSEASCVNQRASTWTDVDMSRRRRIDQTVGRSFQRFDSKQSLCSLPLHHVSAARVAATTLKQLQLQFSWPKQTKRVWYRCEAKA